jgi:hypothetical protein
MSKQIARLLKTDVMADIDIPAIAQFLQSQGRRGDTILAHINAKEAEMLKKMGGAEERNPVTGLPEYFSITDYGTGYGSDYDQTVSNYVQPRQGGNLNEMSNFDLEARQSPFYGEYGGTYTPFAYEAPTLTSSGIDPTEYYAARSYEGSAFPYQAATPDMNPDEYGFTAGAEFPSGMSSRYSLPAGAPAAERTLYDVSNTSPAARRQALQDLTGGRNLNPNITIPERPSSINFGPASSEARDRSDLEFARERGVRGAPGMMDRASAATGLSKEALARLGLAGVGTLQGIIASREASEQGRQARRDTEALARPYQQRGQQLTEQAQSGELTAAGQQQLQALRARLAQGAEARGGVGAAQAAAQVEAFRQNLLQNQYDYGQKVSNIGDQLMLGAIRTGLEADRYAAGLSNTYFTNMASIAAGMPVQSGGER